MPSVKDELEELRRRSSVKAHAAKLQDANGLSTPEQEEQALKQLNDQKKVYSKDAVEILKAGSKAVDQDLEFKVQQKALKKQDLEKKKEAAKNLQSFKSPVKTEPPATATSPASATATATTTTVETVETPTKTTTDVPVAIVEDVPDMDDVPELEELATADEDAAAAEDGLEIPESNTNLGSMAPRVANRAEKKARKVMERLGMKPVVGVSRVTLKMRGNQGFFTIYQPDVFEKSGSFVLFGEARQGTGMPQMQQQAQAVQKLATPVIDEKKIESEVEEEEEAVDESGVEAKDIELVMSQAGCSRSRAVKALKDNDGDLVNAIMSLTN